MIDRMKKPIHGDEITIRYNGETVKATCCEVMEIPKRGPGAAKFTILSKSLFHNGGEAFLTHGPVETPLRVERVTTMPHRRSSLVSFYGVFELA